MLKKLLVMAAVVAVAGGFMPVAAANAAQNPPETTKVKICHADAAQSKPYTINLVDDSSIDEEGNQYLNGHGDHKGPVWYKGIATNTWGDIIPPFSYGDTSFPGYNWTPQGQAIYNNDCEIPAPTCDVLTATKLSSTKYQFNVSYTSWNGILESFTYNFGDGSAETTTTENPTTHEYTSPGTYNVSVAVKFTFDDKEKDQAPVTDICNATVVVSEEETPQVLGTTTTSATPQVVAPVAGVNSGSGSIATALAGILASLGALGYGVVRLRKV